jgi:hypothetical protein
MRCRQCRVAASFGCRLFRAMLAPVAARAFGRCHRDLAEGRATHKRHSCFVAAVATISFRCIARNDIVATSGRAGESDDLAGFNQGGANANVLLRATLIQID